MDVKNYRHTSSYVNASFELRLQKHRLIYLRPAVLRHRLCCEIKHVERRHHGACRRSRAALFAACGVVLAVPCNHHMAVIDPHRAIKGARRAAVEVALVEIFVGLNDRDFGIRLIARGNIDDGLTVLRRKENRVIESLLQSEDVFVFDERGGDFSFQRFGSDPLHR